jgi:hypothetical protein
MVAMGLLHVGSCVCEDHSAADDAVEVAECMEHSMRRHVNAYMQAGHVQLMVKDMCADCQRCSAVM